ncbi:glycosyltransferase [Thermomonas flagellata]|uniref:glycosyltransferase n=1 Tax=Thermomonas flagellata TaxID=2888524 RepID=UPI001F03B4A4|nr:glycosyltransferase [Thermomonas flagellata]
MSQDYPLVTFALFAYNQERYIRAAVEAALAQDYPNLEILLSDDASTDATFEIMQDAVAGYRGPHRLRLNRNPKNQGQGGLGAHVNQVLALAQGVIVVFAAGDDVSHPTRVSRLVRLWEEHGRPTASLHSAVRAIDEHGSPLQILSGRESYAGCSVEAMIRSGGRGVLGASHAITRDLFERFGELSPGALFEDRILMFRAFLAGRILYCQDVLVDYRIHSGNISGRAIYVDPVRWRRWVNASIDVLSHYERDCARVHNGTLPPRLLRALANEKKRLAGCFDVLSDRRWRRIQAGWRYAADQTLIHRLAFTLQCAGWGDAALVRGMRYIRNKMLKCMA